MKTTVLLSALLLGASMVCNGQWSNTYLSAPKGFMGSVTLGNKVYFAGGVNETGHLKTVETYDVITKEQDVPGLLSVARQVASGVACGSKVLFGGGANLNGLGIGYSTVDIYDTLTQQWTVEQLSVPRFDIAAVSHGTKVLFAGGIQLPSQSFSDVVDIYDIQTGVWSTAKLSVPREGIAAAVVGDLAIFAGGLGSTTTSVIDIYNFATNTWSTSSLSQARGMASATTVGDKVIIAGGITSLNVPTDRVEIYDAATGRMTLANLSAPRSWLGNAATVNGKAYFVGGANFAGNGFYDSSNVIDIYEPATDSWSVDYLSNAIAGHSVVGVGNYLVVAGGVIGGGAPVSMIEIFYDGSGTGVPLQPNEEAACRIYPNPSYGSFHLDIPDDYQQKPILVNISNLVGQMVFTQTLVNGNRDMKVKAPAGIYLLTVQSDQARHTQLITIQ